MKEQEKLIKENESPVPLPASDEAWNAMRRLLDEHQPEKAIPVSAESGASGSGKRWLVLAVLLLMSSLIVYQFFRPADVKDSEGNIDATRKAETEITSERNNADAGEIDEVKDQGLNSPAVVNGGQSKFSEKENQLGSHNAPAGNKHDGNISGKKNVNKSIGKNIADDKAVVEDEGEIKNDPDNSSGIVEKNMDGIPGQNNKRLNNSIEKIKDTASANESEQKADDPVDDWRLAGGLFWTLPLNSLSQYETWSAGPNGQPQPYRLLLPGAWIEASHERHLMTLEFNPFASGIPRDIPFKYVEGSRQGTDTLIRTYTSHTMLKSFGASLGMGYQYNINGKLWIGGSFQAILWTRAVEQEGIVYEKIPSNSNPSVFTAESFNYPMKENWEYFSKFQFNLNADLTYREKNWQTGIRTGVALTPFAQKEGPVHPFSASVFFRWRLFYLEKKVTDNK